RVVRRRIVVAGPRAAVVVVRVVRRRVVGTAVRRGGRGGGRGGAGDHHLRRWLRIDRRGCGVGTPAEHDGGRGDEGDLPTAGAHDVVSWSRVLSSSSRSLRRSRGSAPP